MPTVAEATQCTGTSPYNVIDVSRECHSLIKHDTQIPYSGRTDDSGSHEIDADGREPLNVLTRAENNKLCFLCVDF